MAYIVLPESQTSSWIPIVGVALVCLPWAFWFLTCLYRIFSRCCGDRNGVANANGGGGGGGGYAGAGNPHRNADVEVAAQAKSGQLNRVSSVASNESEMALANSMAT